MNNDVGFEIIEKLGVLSESKTGWTKEVNIVSWHGKPEKIDIRSWNPTHEQMTRGITLSEEETTALGRILNARRGKVGEKWSQWRD